MPTPSTDPAQDKSSFEDRCSQLGKRLQIAHRAGLGLVLTKEEVQLLALTTIADWWNPQDEEGQP